MKDKPARKEKAKGSRSRDLMERFIRELPNSVWPDSEDRDLYLKAARIVLPRYLRAHTYLEESGWFESVKQQRPVDRKKNPLPWYTYPAIAYLAARDFSGLSVFEFGSGGSTLWWAARARQVTAVEHHPAWVEEMRPQLPENVTYIHRELVYGGDYCRTAADQGGPFDVIVVDGRDRVNCALHSLETLSERGVIIWDNSERSRYEPGYRHLAQAGFRRVDFEGHGPINATSWMTSIFYRDGNCLGL
jgi:hypothetical protein